MPRTSESDTIVLTVSGFSPDRRNGDGPTVYFDGSCPLCSAEIRHYAAQRGGKKLNFVDVSVARNNLGSDLRDDDALRRFHVRLPDGKLVSGARAFVAIWNHLPGWRWAARMARFPGVIIVLEGAYRLFLPLRPALSKLAARFGARSANPGSTGR